MPTLEITLRPRSIAAPDGRQLCVIRERRGKSGRRRVRTVDLPKYGSAGDLAYEAIRMAIDQILAATHEDGIPPMYVKLGGKR